MASFGCKDFELFWGGGAFGPDLRYLARLVGERKLDPQLSGTMPWEEIEAAMQRLQNRDVAGKLAITIGG